MRLYVICPHCNNKIYLASSAERRIQLPRYFVVTCSNCRKESQHPRNKVIAEPITGAVIGGAFLGGLVGLLGGPLGVVLGAIVGGGAGAGADNDEIVRARRFNEER